jgi:hypothetical protein
MAAGVLASSLLKHANHRRRKFVSPLLLLSLSLPSLSLALLIPIYLQYLASLSDDGVVLPAFFSIEHKS